MSKWISVNTRLPEEGKEVLTKISDADGERNEQPLIYKWKRWFIPKKDMYVYYTPTHWKEI